MSNKLNMQNYKSIHDFIFEQNFLTINLRDFSLTFYVSDNDKNQTTVTHLKQNKYDNMYLSTSTLGSAFIAASKTLGSRWGSAGGEKGLLGLAVMYWGEVFLKSAEADVAYVTRLDDEKESVVVCSSIVNTWFWAKVTIFGLPGHDSSSFISSGFISMSGGCGDNGGELGSGLEVSTVWVEPTGGRAITETTCNAATASSVSCAITLSVCSITCVRSELR